MPETLAQAYTSGGGNGGTNNKLGSATVGMSPPIELRAGTGPVVNIATPADLVKGSLGLLGGVAAFFAAVGDAIRIVAGAGSPSSTGAKASLEGGAATGPGDFNGGDVDLLPGAAAGVGNRGRAVVDNAIAMENQAAFGAPHIHGIDPTRSLYVTADGVGPLRGGTGIALQAATSPDPSFVGLSVDDENVVVALKSGLFPEETVAPAKNLGGSGSVDDDQSWLHIWGQLFCKRVGAALSSAAAISPTSSIHHVTGTTAISTVTPPFAEFTGDLEFIMDDNCNLATGGNIDPAAVEQANLLASSAASVSGKAKIVLTYDGSNWY